jgi:hypothetical protein
MKFIYASYTPYARNLMIIRSAVEFSMCDIMLALRRLQIVDYFIFSDGG